LLPLVGVGANSPPAFTAAMFLCYKDVYDSYTITGCTDSSYCGVFTRVPARCMGGECGPDPTRCDGAPVYQHGGADGPVLFRLSGFGASPFTVWYVGISRSLETCQNEGIPMDLLMSGSTEEPPGAPTAPGYSDGSNDAGGQGWADYTGLASCDHSCDSQLCDSNCGINVVAGSI
jgi:hypothetical protein